MEELHFNFQIDKPALKILIKAVNLYLEQWPGGSAKEQEDIRTMLSELHKAMFELTFLEGDS